MPPNVSYPVLPTGTVIRQPGAELISEPTGLASITEVYRGAYIDIVTRPVLALSTGGAFSWLYRSPHPVFSSLLAYGVRIREGTGIINGTLTVEYRGLNPALSYPPPPVYTIEVSSGNEPLSTHPLWKSQIAGTATAPLNGAQWVSYDRNGANYNPAPSGGNPGTYDSTTAVFYQWLQGSIFTGIEDYLTAGVIFKKAYTSLNAPNDYSSVASFNSPDGPSPDLPDGYDWFFMGETSVDNAGIYVNEASWKAVPTGDAAKIIYGGG